VASGLVVRPVISYNHNETLVSVVQHGIKLGNHNETLIPLSAILHNHNETLVSVVRHGVRVGNHNETVVRAVA
jgi:hypothetical protein